METAELVAVAPDALPVDEWVVVFYPQTCALRLHPSLHAAQAALAKHSWPVHIYRSPLDLKHRHDHFALEKFWRGLHESAVKYGLPKYSVGQVTETDETPPDLPTDEFSKELWGFMQRVGDRVIRLSTQFIRSKEHYEIKKNEILELIADEQEFKNAYPKQARIILEALSRFESPYVLESDLVTMMRLLVINGRIKTKQDSWRLFQYYRPQYIDNGLLIRGEEASGENEDE